MDFLTFVHKCGFVCMHLGDTEQLHNIRFIN